MCMHVCMRSAEACMLFRKVTGYSMVEGTSSVNGFFYQTGGALGQGIADALIP